MRGRGGGFKPLPLQTLVAKPQRRRNYLQLRLFSVPVFSYNAYFITHLLLRCIFSFRTFSFCAVFHPASSPNAQIFIPRILLWRLFSLYVISYDAYFNSAHSPTALKEKGRRGKKMTLKKIPKGSKMLIFEKKSTVTLSNDLIFCLSLKKKCILRCRRIRTTMFGALSYGA